jgi:hypothetical protein
LAVRGLKTLQKPISMGLSRIAPTFSNRFSQDIRRIFPRVHIDKICARTSKVLAANHRRLTNVSQRKYRSRGSPDPRHCFRSSGE